METQHNAFLRVALETQHNAFLRVALETQHNAFLRVALETQHNAFLRVALETQHNAFLRVALWGGNLVLQRICRNSHRFNIEIQILVGKVMGFLKTLHSCRR
ncbi:hypothetical protein [Leptospira noguchii]|uniref:Uncharacterized protein n=1 Tax=Leptospira noguchii TaxID=28182 RepID=A0AAE9GEW9_9LEPT|nr:hypothetical protein [Leptospira noguchii]UOG56227.1 hypothetical protein MAL03_15580 [Leptospira noguchii]